MKQILLTLLFCSVAVAQAPSKATSPSPSNGATKVHVDSSLSWTGNGDTYDVYLSLDSTIAAGDLVSDDQAGVTYNPPGYIANGHTYYWRIDSTNGEGTTTGDVWQFTTTGNIFTADVNVVGLWKFEPTDWENPTAGLLLDYSGQANHLSAVGIIGDPVSNTTDYREKGGSTDDEAGTNAEGGAYFICLEAALSARFPLVSTYASPVKVSVTGWFKPESIPTADAADQTKGLFCKWNHNSNSRTMAVYIYYDTGTSKVYLAFAKGYNSGASAEFTVHSTQIQAGRWYHVGVTYDDTNGAVNVRVWDDTAASVVGVTDTHEESIHLDADTGFKVGLLQSTFGQRYEFDGLLDEVVVFNDILTSNEIDLIRQGLYGATPSANQGNHRPIGVGMGKGTGVGL